MPERASRLIHDLGEIDPTMLEGVVDTSPTLEEWASVRPILADMDFVMASMAAAYDAAIYNIGRNSRGETGAIDVPIGAAVGDSDGYFFQGYASDKELGERRAHAEVMAMDHAEVLGMSLGGLTIASTVEPCPSCLEEIEQRGISRVIYAASRRELEVIGFVKPHGIKAPELVKKGRIHGRGYGFEFFQIPNRAVQAACLELFIPFQRNAETETVEFDKSKVRATRFSNFTDVMDELPREGTQPAPERSRLVDNFSDVLGSFYKKVEAYNE